MNGCYTSGVSTDEARTEDLIFGLNERYTKYVSSYLSTGHQGKLTAVYRDAVELCGGTLVGAGGAYTTFGLLGGCALMPFAWPNYVGIWEDRDVVPFLAYVVMPLLAILGQWSVFWLGVSVEMFSPSEMPVYLDRARRKIYYVHQGRKRFYFFGPSRVEARSADWSLVDCELHSTMGGGINSVHRVYSLLFLVRKSESDPTIVDSFTLEGFDVGSALWQYIVGYMDGTLPPLAFGEKVPALKGKPFDLWESIKMNKLSHYWRDWKVKPWGQFWWTLFLPLNAVFVLVNRFVVWTGQTVRWPQEIKDALGAQVTEADVAQDTEHRLRAPDPKSPQGIKKAEATKLVRRGRRGRWFQP